jgi:DNA (cytosine-5)-methyltransferase 1
VNVGSLFAGIGGFDLGFERAGMRVSWQVEQDAYCRAALARHFPDAVRLEDVRGVGAHNLDPVDLVCGGFPC